MFNKINRLFLSFIFVFSPIFLFSQEDSLSIDEKINQTLKPATDWINSVVFYSYSFETLSGKISVPLVVIWLLAGAIFFTIFFKFINLKGIKHSLDIVRGKYFDKSKKSGGEVTPFQALTAALSATVGLGNISGVAIAITIGGPGATFWMIVAGFMGMSTKFIECTLGVKYRKINEDGEVSGGPMYYLSRGLKELGFGKLGMVLAVFFSIMCIGGSFGGGNMFQVNQAVQQLTNITGGESSILFGKGWVLGIVFAALVGVVIIGGIKSIANVTDKIVPFMCGVYVLAALVVIFGSISQLPNAVALIFSGAFSPIAIKGGFVGVLIAGMQRAAFSNEAGVGSASIAHSAVKTEEPVSEGFVALLEPFIDTVVVCTMTALVIIITGAYNSPDAANGIELTSSAFEKVIGWFPWVLTAAVVLFAFSTMVSWSYYGLKAWTFLFGESKSMDYLYKVVFCGFVVLGASMGLESVIGFSDAMIFAMCFPNVLGLIMLSSTVRNDLVDYLSRVKSGAIKRFN